MNDKKILLIGGAGFIGHHLALELKRLGATVAILDSLQVNNLISLLADSRNPRQDLYVKFINHRLDLLKAAGISVNIRDARDYQAVTTSIVSFKPNVVVHLAAVAHANISNKDPFSTFDHSLRTLENVLDASRGLVEHFIYFSSSMAYGHFPQGKVTEDTPCQPLGIYGSLKLAGEQIVKGYHQVFGMPYTIIRPSALYGERCISRRVGQLFIEDAINGIEICVNGDGSDRLDFTYVKDLVQGVVKVIEHERSRNEIFNLTFGESRSIGEMAEILSQHFSNITIKYLPKDALTPNRGTLCVDKARQMIGYQPNYPLEKGFANYIEWYKQEVMPLLAVKAAA